MYLNVFVFFYVFILFLVFVRFFIFMLVFFSRFGILKLGVIFGNVNLIKLFLVLFKNFY